MYNIKCVYLKIAMNEKLWYQTKKKKKKSPIVRAKCVYAILRGC